MSVVVARVGVAYGSVGGLAITSVRVDQGVTIVTVDGLPTLLNAIIVPNGKRLWLRRMIGVGGYFDELMQDDA